MTALTNDNTNNWRNWFPLLTTYAYIALVCAGALWFFRWREQHVPWWTDIPVAFVAMVFIGPAQHRLLILGQEAAQGLLFRNRWLNEIVGDWLIHFPFSSATQHVRLQTLAHYEHPNNPARDADLIIATRAGFWPLQFARLLRLSAFIKWNAQRANFNFEKNPNNPYLDLARPPSKVALHIGTGYVLLTFAFLLSLYFRPQLPFMAALPDTYDLLVWVPPVLWVVIMVVFIALPANKYHQGRVPTLYSPKVMTLMRITFITLVNCGLGWTTYLTERSAVLNYIALWIAPMFTSTAALMLIRQWRQHGNLPKGAVAHDRRPGLLGKLLLFPFNQHRHTAKHAHPQTPWYRLR